ncbi:hypothetical protein IAR50_000287 [Cryptococcus sp. DSM 104548]
MDNTRLPRPTLHSSFRPPSISIPTRLPAPTSSIAPAARLRPRTLSRQPTSSGLRSGGPQAIESHGKVGVAGASTGRPVTDVATGSSAPRRLLPSRSTLALPSSKLPPSSAPFTSSPDRRPALAGTRTATAPLRPATSSNPLGPKRTVSSVASSASLRGKGDVRRVSDGKNVQKSAVSSLGRVGGLQRLRDANLGLSKPPATKSPSRIPSLTTPKQKIPTSTTTHAYPYTPTNPFCNPPPTETPLLPRLPSTALGQQLTGESADDNLMDMDMSFADEDGFGDSVGERNERERAFEYQRPRFTPRRSTPPSALHLRKALAESKKELLSARKARDELSERVDQLEKDKMRRAWDDVVQKGELELREVRQAMELVQRLRVEHGL